MIRFIDREWVAHPVPAYSNKIMVTALLGLLATHSSLGSNTSPGAYQGLTPGRQQFSVGSLRLTPSLSADKDVNNLAHPLMNGRGKARCCARMTILHDNIQVILSSAGT